MKHSSCFGVIYPFGIYRCLLYKLFKNVLSKVMPSGTRGNTSVKCASFCFLFLFLGGGCLLKKPTDYESELTDKHNLLWK